MNSYIVIDSAVIPLIGANTYSTGDGLELSQRYGYDASKRPQSLTHRKRNTALTATIQIGFTPKLCIDAGYQLFDYISSLEDVCGKKADIYWNGRFKGSFVISGVEFSASVDIYSIFPEMSVSLSMTEGFIKRETLQTAVSTL